MIVRADFLTDIASEHPALKLPVFIFFYGGLSFDRVITDPLSGINLSVINDRRCGRSEDMSVTGVSLIASIFFDNEIYRWGDGLIPLSICCNKSKRITA